MRWATNRNGTLDLRALSTHEARPLTRHAVGLRLQLETGEVVQITMDQARARGIAAALTEAANATDDAGRRWLAIIGQEHVTVSAE